MKFLSWHCLELKSNFPFQEISSTNRSRDITGSPSSSCEMIILRNNSQGGIIRVCMGMFTTALRNKKIRQILKKIPHLTSTVYRLLSNRLLWWKEPILASCSFRGFQRTWEKPFPYERWKPRNRQLAKMRSFHQSKRSDNKQYAMEVRWGIFFENLTYYLFLKAVVNIPIQTLIIPPWLLLRKMIISQLELGPPVEISIFFFLEQIFTSGIILNETAKTKSVKIY